MKKKRRSIFSWKKVIIIAIILLVVSGGIAAFLRHRKSTVAGSTEHKTTTATSNSSSDGTLNLNPPTQEEKDQAEAEKVKRIEDPTTSAPASDSVTIASAYQDPSSNSVVVTTQLKGTGWSKCDLTLTKDSVSFHKTAGVVFQPSFSSCLGFSVEPGEFSSTGTWTVGLKATKTDGTSQLSATKTVNVAK